MSKATRTGFIQHHFLGAKSGAGFTIIELLVVIAIIGLISSVVLVSMKGSTGKAKIAKSLEFSQTILNTIGVDAVGIWSFDEGSGGTAFDKSGYGNHGTLAGGMGDSNFVDDTPHAFVNEGEGRTALSFNGTTNYIDCGDSTSLNFGNEEWTIEVWVRPFAIANLRAVIAKGSYTGNDEWLLYFHSSHIRLCGHGDNTSCIYPATNLLNRWHHIAVGRNGDDGIIFIDGVEVEREVNFWQGYNLTNAHDLTIGARQDGTQARFSGLIDEVRIYERALSSAEIQQHYAAGAKKHQLAISD